MNKMLLLNLSAQEIREMIREELESVIKELNITKEESDRILDLEEACQILNLKKPTVYEKTSKALIPHFKKGKKLYFKEKELREWIEAGKQKTQADYQLEAKAYTSGYPLN